MIGTLPSDLTKQEKAEMVSSFMPSQEVIDLTDQIKRDYQIGYDLQRESFKEFNDTSLLGRMNADQKAFNNYIEAPSLDPQEAWHWNGNRPMTRNKIISMAAHATFSLMKPQVLAQNEMDEEDKDAALVMADMLEWNVRNSGYDVSFLFAVISALVNPVAYLDVKYVEATQKIRTRMENGEITVQEALDEVLSGIKVNTVPPEEVMITNVYEFEHQKQRATFRRRLIDYAEAKAIYGWHENFGHVSPGVKVFQNDEDGLFYQMKDDENPTLIEEVTYYNRGEDVEVVYLNGIYMGEDDVEANMMKHRDNSNRPKYNIAKSGFEPIDEKRFYYYKSAVSKLSPDQALLDRMWRMTVDGTFLSIMPPVITTGAGQVNTDLIFPGASTDLDKDATVNPLSVSNPVAGLNMLQEIERSMEGSSQSEVRSGGLPDPEQKAFNVSRAEENALINSSLFGKMIASLVTQTGDLMVDQILHHQTIGDVDETTAGEIRLKYRNFLLPDQNVDGNTVTKKIRFTDRFMGTPMSEEERLKEEFKLLEDAGEDSIIYEVNPVLFRKMRYLTYIRPEQMVQKTKTTEMQEKLVAYDRMIIDPFSDKEAVSRDFLYETFAPGQADKYMMDEKARELGMESLVETPEEMTQESTRANTVDRSADIQAQVEGSVL